MPTLVRRWPDRVLLVFPSLRHRDFRIFLGGQFVSLIGTWMQTVAHGWLVLTLTDSPFLVGLVSTLGALPILLFTLYGGVLADRLDKRRFILLLQTLMMLEALSLAWLTWRGLITVPWVMVLAVFFGLLSAFEVPTRQAFVADLVGRDDLTNAIALNSTAFNLSRVVGPALAGGLIALAGLAACFLTNGISYMAVIAGLVAMRPAVRGPVPPAATLGTSLRAGFDYVFGERWPRALILLTAVFSIFGLSFITMLPVYARDALGLDAGGYGGLVTSVGVGAAIGALALAGLGTRLGQIRLIKGSSLAFGLVLLLTAAAPAFAPAAVLFAAAGGSMALQGISSNSFLQRAAPDHLRGRVMGFYSFVALGMAPFGSFLMGWIAEHFGVRAAFATGGIACGVGALVLAWRFRMAPPPAGR